jgi:hypothetical protein
MAQLMQGGWNPGALPGMRPGRDLQQPMLEVLILNFQSLK